MHAAHRLVPIHRPDFRLCGARERQGIGAADLRRVTDFGQRITAAGVGGETLERRVLAPPVVEVRIGPDILVETLSRVVGPQHHQPIRVWGGEVDEAGPH